MTLAVFGLNKEYTVALVGFTGTFLGAVVAFLGIRWQVNRQEREKQIDHATPKSAARLY
ncbi:hypothetical protein [Streptomyces albogriseolus]|uniref:Uncharacterized protein n=1 Tax=Streptomyces albogriseolus TaxID=1887 RepID=A0ACC6UY00_STRAO